MASMIRCLFPVYFGLLSVLALTLHAGAAETVCLAHDDPFPPFALQKDGGSEGIIIDILQEALKRVNIQPVFIPAHMDKIQDLVKAEKADGLAFLGITADRQKLYDFSEPLLITGGALFVKAPQLSPSGLAEFEGRTVVTPLKGPLAGYIKNQFPKVNLVTVEDYPEALKAVLEKKADAAALNPQVGIHLANQFFPGNFTYPKSVFLKVPLAVAVLKGTHAALLQKINEGLEKIKADGTYATITEKWANK
jgi:ABC-type amino acid transport substrate-binding protein